MGKADLCTIDRAIPGGLEDLEEGVEIRVEYNIMDFSLYLVSRRPRRGSGY